MKHRQPSASRWPWLAMFALVALCLTAFGACGDDDSTATATATTATSTSTPTQPPLSGEITVFAAASLTGAFTAAGKAFEAANPGTTVKFNFASSSALAVQINEGAPADVFASADQNQMKVVTDAGNASGPEVFVQNLPVVAVPADEPVVATFEDLANDGIRLVLAGPDVPIGRYSREIFTRASTMPGGIRADFSEKVLANLQSDEANVRAVLTKVQLGEADAGIVYKTDIPAAQGEAKAVEIPAAYNVIATYPIATLTESGKPDVAAAFVAFILSDEGQEILGEYGFDKPS